MYFYLNMVGRTQWNLISQFCDKNIVRLLCTSGFNVKVLKLNLMAFFFFYNLQMSTVTASGNE